MIRCVCMLFRWIEGEKRHTNGHWDNWSMGERTRVSNKGCLFGTKKQSFILEGHLSEEFED